MSLDSLYQEIILDHYKNPRNYGTLDAVEGVAIHQENPSCGDQIDLRLHVQDGKVVAIRFSGKGCAISQASASMMTLAVEGKSTEEARSLIDGFRKLLIENDQSRLDELGDLEALQGVRKFPVRVKCATLAWSALEKLLNESEK
jgi:nitrogen fixation protein NifU and related proteins